MAFGSFSTPSVDTKNIAGYNAPQALFADVPSGGPGSVTSNVVASMPVQGMDIQDQIAAYNFAKQQKADREAEWARAAEMNRMRQATSKVYGGGGHYSPPTISQSNPRQYAATQLGASGMPGYSGPVLWAPPGLMGPQLGSWSEKQQKIAMEQNRQPPLILQNYQR